MRIKAVIFDLDGVIADTNETTLRAFIEAFKELNLEFEEEYLRKGTGSGVKDIIEHFLKDKKIPYDNKKIEELVIRKSNLQLEKINEIKILPGVVELLEELQNKNISIALATSNTIRFVIPFLEKKSLDKYFKIVITREDVKPRKPAPDIYIKTAEKLRVDPKDCVVIEDAVVGIRTAKNAGMESIAVPTGPTPKSELEKENPDLIVDSLEEFDKIIEFLEAIK